MSMKVLLYRKCPRAATMTKQRIQYGVMWSNVHFLSVSAVVFLYY